MKKKELESQHRDNNEDEVTLISEGLKRKLRKSVILRGAIGGEGIEELSLINSKEELDRWFNKYADEREHLIIEYKKILREEGYDE